MFDACCDRSGHRELGAVEVGAVADVLDDVGTVDEGRHPDPLRAFIAHAVMPAMSPTWSGSISSAIVWQPMPAPTRAPSGTAWSNDCAGSRSSRTATESPT